MNEGFVSLIGKLEEKVEMLSGRRGPPPREGEARGGHADVFHDMAVRTVARERAQMTEALQAIHTKLAAAVSVSRAPSSSYDVHVSSSSSVSRAPSPALPRDEGKEKDGDGGLVGEGAEWLGEGGGKRKWERVEERETPNPRTGEGDREGEGERDKDPMTVLRDKDPMTVVLVSAEV